LARIAGVDLPRGKRMEIALTYIYGIGRTTSQEILTEAGIDWDIKSDEVTAEQVTRIRKIIDEKHKVDGFGGISRAEAQERAACPRSENQHQRKDAKRPTPKCCGKEEKIGT